MNKNSEKVINWRARTKQRMVDAFGGECGICKYNKFIGTLEFHHLNSDDKERGLAGMIVNPSAWNKIVTELRKCVCLCANCHREVHGNIISIPQDIKKFDENFVDYKKVYEKEMDECPICKTLKLSKQKTCSYKCAAKIARKFDWGKYDLYDLYFNQKLSMVKIGKLIGCSDNAVKKRMKKLKMI